MMDNKSRMMGDCQVRFCERLKLKCFCLLDSHRQALRARLVRETHRGRSFAEAEIKMPDNCWHPLKYSRRVEVYLSLLVQI